MPLNQSLNVRIAVIWWHSVLLVKTGLKSRCYSSIFALLAFCSAVSYLGFHQTMHFLCTLLIQYQGVDKHEYFTRFQIEILVWSPNLHHLWQCTNHLWQCLLRSHSGSFKDVILCILYTASVFLVYSIFCYKSVWKNCPFHHKHPLCPHLYYFCHIYDLLFVLTNLHFIYPTCT